jgi:hypothetical protein
VTGTNAGRATDCLIFKPVSAVPGDAMDLVTDAVDATSVATGAIDADAIASNAITSSKIATDAIGAAQIAANAIGSSEIADNAITANKIATDAITAAKIAANAISAVKIASNAITAAKIANDAITAAKIAADAIGASELATDAINEIRDSILSDSTPFAGANIDATISSRSDFDETADPVELLDTGGTAGTSASELVVDVTGQITTDHGSGAYTTATGFSTHNANDVRDAILSDSTPFPGANIDAAITSRSSHAANDVRDAILSDSTPFAGADVTLTRKKETNRLELAAGSTSNWILYDDDNSTPLLTFDVTDKDGAAIILSASSPAKRTKGV